MPFDINQVATYIEKELKKENFLNSVFERQIVNHVEYSNQQLPLDKIAFSAPRILLSPILTAKMLFAI